MIRLFLPIMVAAWLPLCAPGQVQIGDAEGPSLAAPRPSLHASLTDIPPGAIQVESALVEVPVHVTNALGVNVTGLRRSDFELWEDGVEQPITYFSMEDAPASIGLVYDCSGSMRGKMRQEATAAEAFMRTANPDDEFFLVEFGERAKLASRFTTEPADILRRIARTHPFGRTPLMDALFLAMQQMKNAHKSRKALLVLSDGGDNQSRRNIRQIRADLMEADLQVYVMGLYSSASAHKLTSEEKKGPVLLSELAQVTGGHMFPASREDELAGISERISHELRAQYVLGYLPQLNHDGKYHHITVKVHASNVRIHFRQGYYEPEPTAQNHSPRPPGF